MEVLAAWALTVEILMLILLAFIWHAIWELTWEYRTARGVKRPEPDPRVGMGARPHIPTVVSSSPPIRVVPFKGWTVTKYVNGEAVEMQKLAIHPEAPSKQIIREGRKPPKGGTMPKRKVKRG